MSHLSESDREDLIEAIQNGDEAAWAEAIVARNRAEAASEALEAAALRVSRMTVSESARTHAYPIDAALLEAARLIREGKS